jgi:hypothetical protein
MNIAETREKCKTFIAKVPRDILIIIVLILSSSASFGLGYLAGTDADPPSPEATAGEAGKFVASKNGTKYYLPSCAGVEKITDANKVWFASAAAAQAAGYTPATNCKGL